MLFKLLGVVVIGYVLYRLFMNDKKKQEEAEKEYEAEKKADGTLVRDPICGTYVEKESSISVRDGKHVEYFCGHECRNTYIKQIEEQEKIN